MKKDLNIKLYNTVINLLTFVEANIIVISKNFIYQMLFLITILILLISNFNSCFGFQKNNFYVKEENNNESYCWNYYGFIIPLPSGKDTSYETFLNSKVRHLINDLLRENLTVYWSTENFNALIKNIHNEIIEDQLFKKGDFIIPFTDNFFQNTLITSIILDYNYSSEIENDDLQIEIYFLMETLNISGYQLSEPKIAQHFGTPIRYGWPAYLQIVEAGGFFSIDLLLDNETADQLNNNDYNVFMWPYNPSRSKLYEILNTLLDKKQCNAVRNFVKNGGGYIGSCYGAEVASSGMLWPLQLVSLLPAYYPNLRSFGIFYSMSDSITLRRLYPDIKMLILTTKIEDTNHPITYGLNKTFKDFFDGAWFPWTGKNTHTIATMENIVGEGFKEKYPESIIGTSSWMNTTFGKGKLVLFPSHPEFVNNLPLVFDRFEWDGDKFYGRRVMHNSIFFVSSKKLDKIIININVSKKYVQNIKEKTVNIDFKLNPNKDFENIKNRLINLNENITLLNNTNSELGNIFSKYINDTLVFQNKHKYLFTYTYHVSEILKNHNKKAIIYLDLLSSIYPLILQYNDSIEKCYNSFKLKILMRLNQSEKLIQRVNYIANQTLDLIKNKRSFINNYIIVKNSRKMLSDFQIELKYIPQIYFDSCKLSRSFWYNYEANFFVNNT